jgi:hypothetical protein
MVARALGARVYAGPKKEIGWFPIRFTKEAEKDPVFQSFTSSQPVVFHWHGDTFDLPKGAALLASSQLFRHQAFRFGHHVYAFQFHIEVTPEMIQEWVVKGKNELSSLKPLIAEETILNPILKYEQPLKELAEKVYAPLFTINNTSFPLMGEDKGRGEKMELSPHPYLPPQGGKECM